jgi:NADH-quinone oxidoreductase subunit J
MTGLTTLADYATTGNTGETLVFWVCAVVAVAGGLGMLFSRKAIHSALFLAATMIALAVLYIAMEAPFLGTVQIVVYTGAVMMLFVFVLMMVGVDASDSVIETIPGQRVVATLFGLATVVLLIAAVGTAATAGPVGLEEANTADGGNVQAIARLIFGRYLLAFEVTSALLITAALGAMVLAFRERARRKPSQAEVSRARFREGGHVTPLPGPGVYARHNAVGTPGLLPDRTTSDLSVPETLRGRGVVVDSDSGDLRQVRDLAERRPVVGEDPRVSADVDGEDGHGDGDRDGDRDGDAGEAR